MSIVDGHVHLYPPEINADPKRWAQAHGESHWNLLCARVRKNGRAVQGFPSVKELLAALDEAQVERAVLQGWYWENHDSCREQNRFYEECIRAYPDRLSACGTFHPAAGAEAIRTEIHWLSEAGFCGVGELSPHSQGFRIDDPVWQNALALCGDLQLPVLLHVTEPESKVYPGRILTPLEDFVRWAQAFPQVVFILAHWGARLPFDPVFGETIKTCRNVFFDTAASPLLYDDRVFPEMINAIGADRILFGSDFPLNLYPQVDAQPSIASFVNKIKARGLPPETLDPLFQRTARQVFKLA